MRFETDHGLLSRHVESALSGLRANIQPVHGYPWPVLREGAEYQGVWLECAPHEGLVYAMVDVQTAVHNHRVFFNAQHADGYISCWVWSDRTGTGQIQQVVPIGATALELFELTGDLDFLTEAYEAVVKWDRWIARYRNTRGTGLCEAFCEYDTGHDNSPRFRGLAHECVGADARVCPAGPGMPRLAPDLSATVYGQRVALSRMAERLGRSDDAELWGRAAAQTCAAIMEHCFDPHDQCFYDVDTTGDFVRINGDAMLRVLCEGVPDDEVFESIYHRHVSHPDRFWTPLPLPSIAADDPLFEASCPPNAWSGASQALTALRAPRWMARHGKHADLNDLLGRWAKALVRSGAFLQQADPFTGVFTREGVSPLHGTHIRCAGGYSPAMLVLLEAVARRHGVRREGNRLSWACQAPEGATGSRFSLETPGGVADLVNEPTGSTLRIGVKEIACVRGTCKVVTDLEGTPLNLVGISRQPQVVTLSAAGSVPQTITLRADDAVSLATPPATPLAGRAARTVVAISATR